MVFASIKKIAVLAAVTVAAVNAATTPEAPFYNEAGILQVGTQEALNVTVAAGLSRDDVVSYPQASYVAVHFANFNLPEGDIVVVRSPDSSVAHFYTGKGRDDRENFIASFIPGDTAIVQYFSAAEAAQAGAAPKAPSYTISGFSRGFPSTHSESVCGVDNTRPAKCFASGTLFNSLPLAYEKAQSVARLLIGGQSLCTGWLAGSEGHLITNQHCIETAAAAAAIDIEFAAESASCSIECTQQLGCPGKVVATSATFVTNSEPIDYALLKLPATADISAYKFLQLRASGPVLNERIYIPQHPAGKAKRISSTLDSGSNAIVERVGASHSCGSNQVLYNADTEGGSSGSPILAASDNKVVALHHCGGCRNAAVDIRDVIRDLNTKRITVSNLLA
jgi:hypothetical protein|uniref:Serine protease n=1 Tax=Globisporangium ultimum (strain ATCC 200006 / CBS 805.95 / DAOM BR144) TaxID=431595 RepID=K3W9D4_GLOUD